MPARQIALTQTQARVLASSEVTAVCGPPGSGKTTALAAYSAACAETGKRPLVIVSHGSGGLAFGAALAGLGCDDASFDIGTLSEHAARWMRAEYLGAGAAGFVTCGGEGATRAVVAGAARGLLDMTWPMFARSEVNLDLPYLSRPDTFLDEAASLFRLLQRSRVGAQEFEEGCARGLGAFYGEQTERACALLADRSLDEIGSRRAREAMRATPSALARQRVAERDLSAILGELYRHYLEEAQSSAWRSPEDLIDACVRWFERDPRACDRVARSIGALVIDDAEDAEPALGALVALLRSARPLPLVLAGWDPARVDGLHGRRSALGGFAGAERVVLEPAVTAVPPRALRFEDETHEVQWLGGAISDLIAQGVPPERIALLTRDDDAAAHYAGRLAAAGVPVLSPSSRNQRPADLADLFALAAAVFDPMDQAHLMRVLSSPLCGLSDASLRAMCREPQERQQLRLEIGEELAASSLGARPSPDTLARNMFDGSVDASLPEAARSAVRSLRSDMSRWQKESAGLSRTAQFAFLARAAGFVDQWHAAPAHERLRLGADFERVVRAVASVEAAEPEASFATIEELLDERVVRLVPAPPVEGAVAVETIVGCKGRQFDHVFVSGVAHERFPRIYTSHAMAFSRTYGLIVRENVAPGASQTAKFAWYYARFGAKSMYLDEEQRALAYGLSRGRCAGTATGFGTPPNWARGQDLLARFEATAAPA